MILSDLQGRLLNRAGEFPDALPGNQFYQVSEATAALNSAQRLMALLTLCLETTGDFTLPIAPATAPYYKMLPQFPDWLLPLRIRLSTGAKLRPSRLSDFAAMDSAWSTTVAVPQRYALLGFDFLAVYPAPYLAFTAAITYARCPDLLVTGADVPEVPDEYHPDLIDGAIPLMRVKEGGGELQKTMPNWNRFLDACQKLGDYVRARNQGQGYDYTPVELRRFDRSKLLMSLKEKRA